MLYFRDNIPKDSRSHWVFTEEGPGRPAEDQS